MSNLVAVAIIAAQATAAALVKKTKDYLSEHKEEIREKALALESVIDDQNVIPVQTDQAK